MGVPKFFRYISERYPCLSELAREQAIPDFDNLYLDMNGIIHNCSHPDDGDVHFRISEEDIFKDIFKYIEKLFFLIKPQKLFFMAIDGVAPRAKMNQQRARRLRSAKDAETLEKNAKERGVLLPDVERFDSNCITPGTAFMDRLNQALKLFVKRKISSDPLWKSCSVILSGHDCPGEGEHKIMDYIRYLKTFDDYDHSTRHCLYGLDADLIILGLCTHARHFSLLREEVKFQKHQKRTTIEETRFFLMHLGLLREYLEIDFKELKSYENFNINELIDDWILLGFLVGNDFIPHLPNFHINTNALPILYKIYIQVYPFLGGNINESGELNLERLEKFFDALSETEFEIFKEGYADLKYFQAKQSNGVDEAFDVDVESIQMFSADDDLENLVKQSQEYFEDKNDVDSSNLDGIEYIDEEFKLFKRNYYISKLKFEEMTPDLLKEQTRCYVTALQWILYYYYKGVQSWGWFYPHHYAPFVTDMKNFKDFKIDFDMGKPFFPFEQLLAVLPAASKDLIPEAYKDLMVNAKSELISYYPKDFETDLNEKLNEWEAIVLIPFIDEEILLNAMRPCTSMLTEAEVKRNTFGPMIKYNYSEEQKILQCSEQFIWRDDIVISMDRVKVDVNQEGMKYYLGFPTMKHLQYDSDIRSIRVRVFEQPSRNESIILIPEQRADCTDLQEVANKFINKVVYIGWPLLTKAKIRAVSSRDHFIDSEGKKPNDAKFFETHVKTIKEHHINRMGIAFQDISVIVHTNTFTGSNYIYSNGKMLLNEIWSPIDVLYPADGVVYDIDVYSSIDNGNKKIEDIFSVNSRIFFAGYPYFGSEGKVLDPLIAYDCGRIKISITALPEPDLSHAKWLQKQEELEYMNSYDLGAITGHDVYLISRITGTVLVIQGKRNANFGDKANKINIGLKLKFQKQQEETMGYTRKVGNTWLYSKKTAKIIDAYHKRFPNVFDVISSYSYKDTFFESDIFPNMNVEEGESPLNEIVNWIKEQEHMQADKVSNGTKAIEKEAVEAVLLAIEKLKTLPVKTVKLQVKPYLLIKPELSLPTGIKPKRILRLFDRVVVVKNTYQVPIGYKGTIVAIHPVIDVNPLRIECTKAVDNFYEIIFDKDLPGGNGMYGIAMGRVFKVPESAVLVIFNSDPKKTEANEDTFENQSNINIDEKKINSPIVQKIPYAKQKESSIPITTSTNSFWNPAASSKPITIVSKIVIKNDIRAKEEENKKTKNVYDKSLLSEKTSENVREFFSKISIENNSMPQNKNQTPENCDKTLALKTILGLNTETAVQSNVSTLPNKTDVPKPPKPPPSWRSDALKNQNAVPNRRNFIPAYTIQSNLKMPPNNPYHHHQQQPMGYYSNHCPMPNRNFDIPITSVPGPYQYRHPLQAYAQNLPNVAPQQQQPFVSNDNFYNPDNIKQKGAFIPMQVLRGGSGQRSLSNDTINNTKPLDSHSQANHSKNVFFTKSNPIHSDDPIPTTSASACYIVEDETKQNRRPPRMPKIAAKFDNLSAKF